ncbi:MAG: UDP-3-O-acyl-N-acetylglucosamine deacetylase [Kiritimatiellae bacterium]|nr:UDP-3-O-acyl-N-acetylglucosamine deacetylase [Kiritimatiellia bacterium]
MNEWVASAKVLRGDVGQYRRSVELWADQPVDHDLTDRPPPSWPAKETTLGGTVEVRGPGTFDGRETRRLTLAPSPETGWWFERTDRPDDLPTLATVRNVWTTGRIVSNIVLRSGDPHNYCRMVEHILALKVGLVLDRVRVRLDSGDPPLFERGSLDLVEAAERVGIVETDAPAHHVTVREPVAVVAPNGAFLAVAPPRGGMIRSLLMDVAIDFPNVIGRQRIRFFMDREIFRTASVARTNTTVSKKFYCQTIGRLFADVRRLGYNRRNLLIAGRRAYLNRPRLIHNGRSLEAVWHRAALDLAAALGLVEGGRFVGQVVSYRAGHALDVRLITLLHRQGLLMSFVPGEAPAPSGVRPENSSGRAIGTGHCG